MEDYLAIIIPLAVVALYILLSAATGAYPFRGRWKWNLDNTDPVEEEQPKKHVNNTYRIITRYRARKKRADNFPKEWKAKYIERKRNEETQKQTTATKIKPVPTPSHVDVVEDYEDLYEVEPYTGNRRKIRSACIRDVSIPYDYYRIIPENKEIEFYVHKGFTSTEILKKGREVTFTNGFDGNNVIAKIHRWKMIKHNTCIVICKTSDGAKLDKPEPPKHKTMIERWASVLEHRSLPPKPPTPPPLETIYG